MGTDKIIILSLCVVAVTGITALFLLQKRKRVKSEKNNCEEGIPLKALKEFRENSEHFIGLYEPILLMQDTKNGQWRTVFPELDRRFRNCVDATDLQAYWKAYYSDYSNWEEYEASRKVKEFLGFLTAADVQKSAETIVTADENTFDRYTVKTGEAPMKDGDVAEVEKHYWHINGKVLEKGIITHQKGGDTNA